MARSPQPRRALDNADTYLAPTSHPRRSARSGRATRVGIALGSAGAAGALALTAPGLAMSAPSTAPLVVTTTQVEVGTTDSFVTRSVSANRDVERTPLSEGDIALAADARAKDLAQQDAQVSQTQVTAVVNARSTQLKNTGSKIDDQVERLEAAKFYWPTAGNITSPWGMRLHPILRYTRLHGGVDIGGKVGAPIYAVQDGVVTKAATGYNGGSGNNVRIDHGTINGEAIESAYLHMNSYIVAPGDTVKKGELIGYVGNTGLSTASHLHFSVYVNGQNSDPEPYLKS